MNSVFSARLAARIEELRTLYGRLYHDDAAFDYFCAMLERSFEDRKESLRALDDARLAEPDWFRSNKLMGMMLYVNAFAGDLQGVRSKLPYLEECGVNYLHLMPLLSSPKGRSDGGYAVADFRTVQPELGTMADLEALADDCREKGMGLCLDFVMNHTSEDHPRLGDARLCGTTASLCGLESENADLAIACDLMLHAWMLTQSGIPVLYSGDEVGQLNDYAYHNDPDKAVDSRYLHRGDFDWNKAARRADPETHQGRIFAALRILEAIRASERVFRADAKISTFDTGSNQVLGVCRELEGERFVGLFNFSEDPQLVCIPAANHIDLVQQTAVSANERELSAYGFCWMKEM